MSELNPDAVAAAVATDLIKDFFKSSKECLSNSIAKSWERVFPNFQQHLLETHKRICTVKLLCAPDKPSDFASVYVSSELTSENAHFTEDQLVKEINQSARIIIKSNGGTGKTFLIRRIWLSIFDKPKGRFPIYLELRGMNEPSVLDLETYVRATAFKAGGITDENFQYFCKEGQFVFLLDGFELAPISTGHLGLTKEA